MGALDAGAVGYLLKDASAEDVVKGIRAAVEGELAARPASGRTLLEAQTAPDPLEGLSAAGAGGARPAARGACRTS